MIRFHKEGRSIILSTLLLSGLLLTAIWMLFPHPLWLSVPLSVLILVFLGLVLQFFRNPVRTIAKYDDKLVYAPADGEVVVIEETQEDEVLKDRYIQISIFMSPLNVHVNRHPVSGTMQFVKYHEGKFLMAWNPKSSTDNERTTVLYQLADGQKVLLRQIAGFVARRIICYAQEGALAKQGEDMGFIRFGSRVDVFLPIGTKVNVKIGDVVKGNQTILAELV